MTLKQIIYKIIRHKWGEKKEWTSIWPNDIRLKLHIMARDNLEKSNAVLTKLQLNLDDEEGDNEI